MASVRVAPDGAGRTVVAGAPGRTTITLAYQRAPAARGWQAGRQPVTVTLDVTVTG